MVFIRQHHQKSIFLSGLVESRHMRQKKHQQIGWKIHSFGPLGMSPSATPGRVESGKTLEFGV
jgi:hypothetical protein